MKGRKRIIGFGPQEEPEEQPEEQSGAESRKVNFETVLDTYFSECQPERSGERVNSELMDSKDIQRAISGIIIIPVSVITGYMTDHGYKMASLSGKMYWEIWCKDNLENL